MENKKEPLMSWGEFLKLKQVNFYSEKEVTDYANYVTQWHLNNAKEFVADEAKKLDIQGVGIVEIVDKQSIHTAIDNYIEINLNKEL